MFGLCLKCRFKCFFCFCNHLTEEERVTAALLELSSFCHVAVIVLCHILPMQWDGLWSVSLTPDAVRWSVFRVTYSCCSGMVCILCHLLPMQWDGLWSVSITLAAVGWSVVCVTYSQCNGMVCGLCHLLLLQ